MRTQQEHSAGADRAQQALEDQHEILRIHVRQERLNPRTGLPDLPYELVRVHEPSLSLPRER